MNTEPNPSLVPPALRRLTALALLALPAVACAVDKERVNALMREKLELERQNEALRAELAAAEAGEHEFAPIQRFTVGLAAAEQDFDSGAFEELLQQSLKESAGEGSPALDSPANDRELAKIRGMLVQQYLAAEEVPILITNLSYRLADASQSFRIAGTVVPRSEAEVTSSGAEGALVSLREEIPGVLRRDANGAFRIDYEELGGGKGAVEVRLTDLDMITSADGTRAERQGDVSFNWRLNLAEVRVYEVKGFRGDVGRFLRQMRIGGARGELSQFQTLQDTVFLFGYGAYRTDVVSQLRTPSFIDRVEVAAIDAEVATSLTVQDEEAELLRAFGAEPKWQSCDLVEVEGRERVWRRPIEVGFPFVSRQTSNDRGEVFYSLYTASGTRLLGNFSQ